MTTNIATSRRSILRVAVESAVLLLLAALLSETWLAKGVVTFCRVSGGSMGERLPGRHRNIVCDDCGYRFSRDSDCSPISTRAVCPNCGYAGNDPQAIPDTEGERLLVDRASLLLREPRRWEVVALRRPNHADEIAVKRVVGLPGETVEIREGDVYINGEIVRKNVAEQTAVAVPIHDDDFRPTLDKSNAPRWRPETEGSHWTFSEGRFRHDGADSNTVDWLVYHHGRPGPAGFVESPVNDLYGYNQSRPRRDEDIHAVRDLMLSFSLERESDRGMVCVRASGSVDKFDAWLIFDGLRLRYVVEQEQHRNFSRRSALTPGPSPNGKGELPVDNHHEATMRIKQATFDGNVEMTVRDRVNNIGVSLIDRQFMLIVDGRTIFTCPFDRQMEAAEPTATPFAIGVQGMAASVGRLRIWRDVYYTDPIGLPPRGAIRLAADEYFVLGDNSPASEDSRHWPDGGSVNTRLLLGRAVEPFGSKPEFGLRIQTNSRRLTASGE